MGAFAPSGAPPPGQKTETRVPLVSQLAAPLACTARTVLPFFASSQSPARDVKEEGYQPRNSKPSAASYPEEKATEGTEGC